MLTSRKQNSQSSTCTGHQNTDITLINLIIFCGKTNDHAVIFPPFPVITLHPHQHHTKQQPRHFRLQDTIWRTNGLRCGIFTRRSSPNTRRLPHESEDIDKEQGPERHHGVRTLYALLMKGYLKLVPVSEVSAVLTSVNDTNPSPLSLPVFGTRTMSQIPRRFPVTHPVPPGMS